MDKKIIAKTTLEKVQRDFMSVSEGIDALVALGNEVEDIVAEAVNSPKGRVAEAARGALQRIRAGEGAKETTVPQYAYYLCFENEKMAEIKYAQLKAASGNIASHISWPARVERRHKEGAAYPHWVVIYTKEGSYKQFFDDQNIKLDYDDYDRGGADLIQRNSGVPLVDSFDIEV